MNKKRIKYLKELEISSQELIKDNWKLIKKLKDAKNHYYAMIQCIDCGYTKVVGYYSFINPKAVQHRCKKCQQSLIDSIVGKTFGTIKALSFKKQERVGPGRYHLYFNTLCTKCNNESVRLYNKTQWLQSTHCKECGQNFKEPSYNSILQTYKQGAKSRNIPWNLSNEEFKSLITQNCYYCGTAPVFRTHDQTILKNKLPVNGIDRIDSSRGYEFNNCVPCCTCCNFMKHTHNQKDFLDQIIKIYNYRINPGSTTIENTLKNESE